TGLAVGYLLNEMLVEMAFLMPSSNFEHDVLIRIAKDSITGIKGSKVALTAEQKTNALNTYLSLAIQHPVECSYQRVASLWELWGPWPRSGVPNGPRFIYSRFLIGLRFPLFVLGCYGLWINRQKIEYFYLGVPIVVITIVHVIFFSSPRYTYC